MDWDILSSFLFGIVSGVAEFLPISAHAHQSLFLSVTGLPLDGLYFMRLFAHIGALFAVLSAVKPQLDRFRREKKWMAMPAKRRRRQPNRGALLEYQFFRIAMLFLLISFLPLFLVDVMNFPLWGICISLVINGIFLYIPQFVPGANKEVASLSIADNCLFGLFSMLGRLPGISGFGAAASILKTRGSTWKYAVEISLLLCVPAMIASAIMDIYLIVSHGVPSTVPYLLLGLICGIGTFVSGYFSIHGIRFLAVKTGISGFSYYCWGIALFTYLIYLVF